MKLAVADVVPSTLEIKIRAISVFLEAEDFSVERLRPVDVADRQG
jgi:hypothetical protein